MKGPDLEQSSYSGIDCLDERSTVPGYSFFGCESVFSYFTAVLWYRLDYADICLTLIPTGGEY